MYVGYAPLWLKMGVKIEGTEELSKALKKEVQKMSRIANKRLGRLQMRGYTDTPSYKAWENDRGGVKFGVRGKNYQELQAEYWRVKHFLDARTSTIRGANSYIKEIGTAIGLKGNINELRSYAKTIFQLAQRIQEYDKTIQNSAMALDYQKIFEQINTMIKDDEISFNVAKNGLKEVDNIEKALKRYLELFR